jgi:hypothetical protein
VLLLIAGNISLKKNEETLPDVRENINTVTPEEEPLVEEIQEDDKVEIAKENITSIEENGNQEFEKVTVSVGSGYEERLVPIKKLEPKYDYEAELAFREKGK